MAARDDISDSIHSLDDERTGLVLEPMRWILEAVDADRPFDAIVLEQVPAVLPVWAAYREILEKLGYSVDHGVLRTEEFGVPQTRRRAVLVANRTGNLRVTLPTPTHHSYRRGAKAEAGQDLKPWVPMYKALERPLGFVVVSNYGSGGDPRKRGRRRFDEPSATVTGKVMRNRVQLESGTWDRFSYHEAGRLQTFPRDYPWSGKDIGQQIGNAIPPRLGAHILASALGLEINEDRLDAFTRAPWSYSRGGGISFQKGQEKDTLIGATN
ncbi:DNA cytosine methyltransferase [Dietzia sp. B32]|uniref:DNA cytosine methyltransferase n=1 Tax=Dietzia sp. B32 TaxID=2915130 RepID=UPI0037C125AD